RLLLFFTAHTSEGGHCIGPANSNPFRRKKARNWGGNCCRSHSARATAVCNQWSAGKKVAISTAVNQRYWLCSQLKRIAAGSANVQKQINPNNSFSATAVPR